MKIQIPILSFVLLLAACNTETKPTEMPAATDKPFTADTTGLADYQAWKAQNELGAEKPESKEEPVTQTQAPKAAKKKSTATSNTTVPAKSTQPATEATSPAASNSTASAGTDTASTAEEKKGWSKTAKGAVIGGVVGAGTGAVINKKNRAAGAVIGGIVGGASGAIIGKKMDKKDAGQ